MSLPTPQSTKPPEAELSESNEEVVEDAQLEATESINIMDSEAKPMDVVSMYNIAWDMICPHCVSTILGRDVAWSEEHNQTWHQPCGKPINLKLFSDDLSQMAADVLNQQAVANMPEGLPYLMNEFLGKLSKEPVILEGEGEEAKYIVKPITEDAETVEAVAEEEGTSEAAGAVEEPEEEDEALDEAQRQGTDERVARRTRLTKVTPPDKGEKDLTPRRDADNDPTQTSRGRASVRRQGDKNKKHAASFKRYAEAIEFFKTIEDIEPQEVVERAGQLSDPVSATKLAEIFAKAGHDEYARIAETIRNVFEGKSVELLGSVCKPGLDNELTCFEEAQVKGQELKEWGSPFVWLERVERHGAVIYKAVGDYPPSTLYEDRCDSGDRIILPLDSDKAKIIEIVYGDK